jgi:hypothetical protein
MLEIHDTPRANGLRWRNFCLWTAGLALALLAGCGGGDGGGNGGGSTPPPVVEVPGTPSSVMAAAGDNEVTIQWNSVAGATSYSIYRSTTQGTQGAKVSASTSTSYVDSTAQNGTTYYYQVSASNAAGEGPPSASSAGATPSSAFVDL